MTQCVTDHLRCGGQDEADVHSAVIMLAVIVHNCSLQSVGIEHGELLNGLRAVENVATLQRLESWCVSLCENGKGKQVQEERKVRPRLRMGLPDFPPSNRTPLPQYSSRVVSTN